VLAILTIGFVTGLLMGSYAPFLPATILILYVSAAISLVFCEGRGWLTRPAGHGLFLAALFGTCWWMLAGPVTIVAARAVPATEGVSRLVGTVLEPAKHFPGRRTLVLGNGLAVTESGRSIPIERVRLTWRDPDQVFLPGDRVEVAGKLREPWGFRNPGGFDYGTYLEHRGIAGLISASGAGQVTTVSPEVRAVFWAPWRLIEEWREQLRNAALRSLSGSASGLFLGMILGQGGYVSPEARDAYMATGTVHILSISGSHLGLIAVICFWLAKALCNRLPHAWFLSLTRWITPTRVAALATALPVTFYTLLAGHEVATVRSWLMIMLFLWAVWLGRPNPLLVALCAAALAVLLHDPGALFDISFQLSFLSVLAIGLALPLARVELGLPPVEGWSIGERLRFWGREYLVVTGGLTLATLPLVAYYFNQIAWLGLAANLIVVPVAGFLIVPIGLASAIVGLLTGSATLPAAGLNQWLCDGFRWLVEWVARVPGAEWHVSSPSIPLMLGYYFLLLILLVRGTVLSRAAMIGVGLPLILILGLWIWSPRWGLDSTAVRVTFLDVGQGDATVVELPEGETVVIDGGAAYDSLDLGRAVVAPYLWDQGIRRIDHLIGTHPQLDHVGGLATLIEKFPVGRYWGNGLERTEPFYRKLQETLGRRRVPVLQAGEGRTIIDTPSCRLLVISPPVPPARDAAAPSSSQVETRMDGSAMNNRSLVARLACGSHRFLFAADVEGEAMEWMMGRGLELEADILKVPHHGARSSLHEGWIERVRPADAVISVGRQNAYGHPAPAVVQAYRARGSRVWSTSESGAVSVRGSLLGGERDIHAARDLDLRPVELRRTMLVDEADNLRRAWRRLMESDRLS
jgi:competence protein ComEC